MPSGSGTGSCLCAIQDDLGEGSYLFRNRTTNVRFALRDLGVGPVRRNEKIPACSFFCEMAEEDYQEASEEAAQIQLIKRSR